MAECRLRRPDGTMNVYSFTQGPCTLGRGGAATLRIDDEFMSRIHCEVFVRDDQFVLRDLNSRNGTFVNDQHIQEQMLNTGDRIKIGETLIAFHREAEMVPSKAGDEPPRHEFNATLRIIPKEPVRPNPSSTILIPAPSLPNPTQTLPPKS